MAKQTTNNMHHKQTMFDVTDFDQLIRALNVLKNEMLCVMSRCANVLWLHLCVYVCECIISIGKHMEKGK